MPAAITAFSRINPAAKVVIAFDVREDSMAIHLHSMDRSVVVKPKNGDEPATVLLQEGDEFSHYDGIELRAHPNRLLRFLAAPTPVYAPAPEGKAADSNPCPVTIILESYDPVVRGSRMNNHFFPRIYSLGTTPTLLATQDLSRHQEPDVIKIFGTKLPETNEDCQALADQAREWVRRANRLLGNEELPVMIGVEGDSITLASEAEPAKTQGSLAWPLGDSFQYWTPGFLAPTRSFAPDIFRMHFSLESIGVGNRKDSTPSNINDAPRTDYCYQLSMRFCPRNQDGLAMGEWCILPLAVTAMSCNSLVDDVDALLESIHNRVNQWNLRALSFAAQLVNKEPAKPLIVVMNMNLKERWPVLKEGETEVEIEYGKSVPKIGYETDVNDPKKKLLKSKR